MTEGAGGVDAAVVEVGDGGGVDSGWERERRPYKPVFEFRYEVRLPG